MRRRGLAGLAVLGLWLAACTDGGEGPLDLVAAALDDETSETGEPAPRNDRCAPTEAAPPLPPQAAAPAVERTADIERPLPAPPRGGPGGRPSDATMRRYRDLETAIAGQAPAWDSLAPAERDRQRAALKRQVLGLASIATEPGACGGKRRVDATPVYLHPVLSLPAGASLRIATRAATGDPVIHVQNAGDANGAFVAGNDDCAAKETDTNACVDLPAAGAPRSLRIVVRAFGDGTAGTAQLVLTTTSATNAVTETTTEIAFAGSVVTDAAGLAHQTTTFRAYTTRLQKQATDAVLLLLGATDAEAVAFDVRDGVGNMASLAASGVVTTGTVVVGTVPGTPAGALNVVWDEGATDADGDGLFACLEGALGTADVAGDGLDTDGDGLNDGFEVKGEEGTPPLDLPAWGADPKVQDVFVEADWDQGQEPAHEQVIRTMLDLYRWPPDDPSRWIRVHVDRGVENPAPADDPSLTDWGSWGGAAMRAATAAWCTTLTPNRAGRFHLMQMRATNGTAQKPGWCFETRQDGRVAAHELGHNLNLDHGSSEAAGAWNWKWLYESPMNYAYQDNANVQTFAINKWKGLVFNPRRAFETGWNTVAGDTGQLSSWPFYYKLGAAGEVDWNQDGEHQASTAAVMGRVNVAGENGHLRAVWFRNETDPTLAWSTVAGERRLYLFTRNNRNALVMRYSKDIQRCSDPVATAQIWSTCATWTTNAKNPAVPGSQAATQAAAATEFTAADGKKKLMLVYPSTGGSLRFQIFDGSSWTKAVALSNGAVSGAPAAVLDGAAGRVDVYAPVNGSLRRWSYEIAKASWNVVAAQQRWSDNSTVAAAAGIGATVGWHQEPSGTFTQAVHAVIPRGVGVIVDFGWRVSGETWQRAGVLPVVHTDARPGLVYVPFQPAVDQKVGRFMFLFRDVTNGWHDKPASVLSQGNGPCNAAGPRSLCNWIYSEYVTSYDRAAKASATLAYDAAFDLNVRGGYTDISNAAAVQPLADGLIDADFRDQNDYPILKKNLACSFVNSRCHDCTALDGDGVCTAWKSAP